MRFQAAAALVVFAGVLWFSVGGVHGVPAPAALIASVTPTDVTPNDVAPTDSAESVMVIVVGEFGRIDRLRRHIPRDQIVADHADAIALAGGRIFATRIEAASAPLSELGWANRSLEIVDPATRRAAIPTGDAAPSAASENLATKDTLTMAEALRLLDESSGPVPAPRR
jgi:hypothetical protein